MSNQRFAIVATVQNQKITLGICEQRAYAELILNALKQYTPVVSPIGEEKAFQPGQVISESFPSLERDTPVKLIWKAEEKEGEEGQ